VPANGPRPAAITISAAHTSSGTLRSTLSASRAASRGARPKRPAAGSASRLAAPTASRVPIAATAKVWSAPHAALSTNAEERSGGKNSPTNFAIRRIDSLLNSCRQSTAR